MFVLSFFEAEKITFLMRLNVLVLPFYFDMQFGKFMFNMNYAQKLINKVGSSWDFSQNTVCYSYSRYCAAKVSAITKISSSKR